MKKTHNVLLSTLIFFGVAYFQIGISTTISKATFKKKSIAISNLDVLGSFRFGGLKYVTVGNYSAIRGDNVNHTKGLNNAGLERVNNPIAKNIVAI